MEMKDRAASVSPDIREQVERAMGDPMRMMPSERAALERQGFVATPCDPCLRRLPWWVERPYDEVDAS